jgi:CDP-paratose 2-epimerase
MNDNMKRQRVLITGGAGFIGSNLVNRLLEEGHHVTIFDNLSRSGCKQNLNWLRGRHGADSFNLVIANLSDQKALFEAAEGVNQFYHLAGQVAVTTSVENPRKDFYDNALGTFNALEAARIAGDDPIFIFASTNKVYGGMEEVKIIEDKSRYHYADFQYGVPENRCLDFHSPYGCSKGAGDQYVRDYARIYNLRSVVMRQSCIYGYRQFGIEDQGWVAWFIIASLMNLPIKIYGNGKQVRDILFVDDLLNAYELAVQKIDKTAGQIFNIGGGPENTLSIWAEFGSILENFLGYSVQVEYSEWRPGDQPIYVSDIRKAQEILGWKPQISVLDGIDRLFQWVKANLDLFAYLKHS